MQPHADKRAAYFGVLVFIAAFLVYGITVTSTYSGDDLQYSTVIQRAVTGDLFYHPTGGQSYLPGISKAANPGIPLNPRYMLEQPTSFLAAKIGQLIGLQGTAITPIQLLRIVVGALGLVLFFLTMNRLVQNIPISLLTTAGLGLTVSYWTYSIHMDQSINMVAALALAFYIFVRQAQTGFTRGGLMWLIIVLVIASLYNFTAAVSTVAFAVGVSIFARSVRPVDRIRQFVVFGVVYTALIIVLIAGSIAVFVSPSSVTDPAFWRSATFGGKPEYLISPVTDAIRAAIGLGKSQILFPGIYGSLNDYFDTASTTNRILLLGYYGIVLIIMALPFGFLALRRKHLGFKGQMALFLTVWLLAHTLFNWFWDPGFNKYWLVPLLCCWAVFALALDHIRTAFARYYRPAFGAVLVFIGLSFALNLFTQFLPDSRAQDNKWLTIANQMKTDSQPQDLFLSPGHPMDFYISYFGHRDILSASLIAYDTNDNQSVLDTTFSKRIADHLADSGKIYVYGLEILNETQRAAFDAELGKGTLTQKWDLPGTIIYEWTPAA